MDKENSPFFSNARQPGLGVVIILLLIGAMIGFQLGRWSNFYELKKLPLPSSVVEVDPSPFFISPLPTQATNSAQ